MQAISTTVMPNNIIPIISGMGNWLYASFISGLCLFDAAQAPQVTPEWRAAVSVVPGFVILMLGPA